FLLRLFGIVLALLQGRAEDVAERGAGIGRAVLGDRFLFLGDFQRLDRDADLVGLLVEIGDPGIDLLALGEALRPLLRAVARQVRPADEGGQVGVDDLHVDAGFLHVDHLAGDHRALADFAARFLERIAADLLDAERDALLLDIDVENLGADLVAAIVVLDRLLAGNVPVEVGEVDHAVDIAVEADEEAELGLVLDLALDDGIDRVALGEGLPRIGERLLEAKRDAPLHRVYFEDHHLHFLAGGDDLAGVDVLLGPRHFGDVDETLDARLQFDEGAVVGDVGDAALELHADRVFRLDALPGIGFELLHAERDAVGLVVHPDDLHADRLADRQDLGRMVDAPPGDVGDV